MSPEMAIEAVEAEAVRGQNAKLAALQFLQFFSLGPPASRGKARRSLATLELACSVELTMALQVARLTTAPNGKGRTSLTELLARASRGVDNEGQDFTPRWMATQDGEADRQRPT
jgi:hypothetical protein